MGGETLKHFAMDSREIRCNKGSDPVELLLFVHLLRQLELLTALHRAGRLLPDDDDRLRDALERNVRIIDDAANSIASVLAEAFDHRGRDVAVSFGGLIDTRLHVIAPGEEVWVAIATQAADGRFVEERPRDVLFGLVLAAAETELREPRADWPSGELAWFEVARLGLREPPS